MEKNEKRAMELNEEELEDISGGHAISRSIRDPRSGVKKTVKCPRCGEKAEVAFSSNTMTCKSCRYQGYIYR